jgi:Ca2+-binding RTX toxin-like protein
VAEIVGGPGDDTLNGTADADTIIGNDGNDKIDGAGGADTIQAGAGDDIIYSSATAHNVAGDTIDGGEGFDTVQVRTAGQNISLVSFTNIEALVSPFGSSGLFSRVSAAQLDGLISLSGLFELVDGGTISLAGARLGNGTAIRFSNVATTLDLSSAAVTGPNSLIDMIVHGGTGNDSITGSLSNDVITGGGGNDTLDGGDGNDKLTGGAGVDIMRGGAGDDTLVIHNMSEVNSAEVYDGGAGFDTLYFDGFFGAAQFDLTGLALTGIERVSDGSRVSDFAQLTMRMAQVDLLSEIDADIVLADGGTLSLAGVTLTDDAIYSSNNATTVDASATVAGFLRYIGGTAVDDVTGTANRDNLDGGGGDDILRGGLGNDSLQGGRGIDRLYGGDGDDSFSIRAGESAAGEIYDGGAGIDTLFIEEAFDLRSISMSGIERIMAGSAGRITIDIAQLTGLQSALGDFQLAGPGNLVLAADGVDLDQSRLTTTDAATTIDARAVGYRLQIYGGAGNDVLLGGRGADVLDGGGGIDRLEGGDGDDILHRGGSGQLSGAHVFAGGDGFDTLSLFTGDFDLTQAMVTGIEYIHYDAVSSDNVLTISVALLNALSSFRADGRVQVADGGTISMNGDTINVSLILLSNAGNIFDLTGSTGRGVHVVGGTSADTVTGSAFNDVLEGGGGADVLNGADGDDMLQGGAGRDTMRGGLGNDTFVITGASDIVASEIYDGGDGFDTLFFYNGGDGLNISNVTLTSVEELMVTGRGRLSLTAAQLDQATSIHEGIYVLTTAGSVSMSGVTSRNSSFILSDLGNSFDLTGFLPGGGRVTGGAGNDQITGASGFDELYGGGGNDVIVGAGGNDVIDPGTGVDRVSGGAGSDTFVFNSASSSSTPTAVGLIDGGADADIIELRAVGPVTAGTIEAEPGRFVFGITVGTQRFEVTAVERIFFGTGDDVIGVPAGYTGTIDMRAGRGNDSITAEGSSKFYGDDGDDSFFLSGVFGRTVSGLVNGGAGLDRLDLDIAFTVDLTAGVARAGDATYSVGGFEHIRASAIGGHLTTILGTAAAETIEVNAQFDDGSVGVVFDGRGGDDILSGSKGADELRGGIGNDVIDGRLGADQLFGGLGNDIFHVDRTGDIVFENAGEGTDTAIASGSFYLYANIENLTLAAGAGNIFGVGNELANTILGNDGENLLIAGAGADIVRGGAARDAIFGEDGDDQLFGDAGIDYIVGGTGKDVIDGGADADEVYGQDGDDTLTGGASFHTDILVGGIGNDVLRGDSGLGDYDLLYGNEGDDRFYVDTPDDLVFEQAGQGVDTVYANINGAGYYLYDHVENLVLEGNTPFGVGNALDNRITGNAAGNYLLGGGGNDTLSGLGGNDVLFGEAGNDVFVMTAGGGSDVIGDFTRGQDRIDLRGLGITGLAQISGGFVQDGNVGAIRLASGDLIVLHNVQMSTLTAGDFIFASGPAKLDAFADTAMVTQDAFDVGSDAALFGDQGAEIWLNLYEREAVLFG